MKFCGQLLDFFSQQTTSVFTVKDFVGRVIPQYRNVHSLTCLFITSAESETFRASVKMCLIIYTITLNEYFMYASPAFSAGP
jgi:hypothetical protein